LDRVELGTKASLKNRKFKFPNAFVVLFFIIVIVSICTYIVPSGSYDRILVDGRTVVDPSTFKYIEQTPIGVFEMFKAIPIGIQNTANLIIMILIIGGAINLVNETGAIESAVITLKDKIGDKRASLVLGGIVLFFGTLGAFVGMLEAAIPFAALSIGICISLGYDVLVGVSLPFIGIVMGFTAGPTNPWTVGVGHLIGELPVYSGITYRIIIFAIYMIVSIAYIVKYGNKVKKDKSKSLVYDIDFSHINSDDGEKKIDFTVKRKIILLMFIMTLSAVVFGTLKLKWGTTEMSATYIIGATLIGIVNGFDGDTIAVKFLDGGKSLFVAAMAIGVSRSIQVIMEQGHIADTIINNVSGIISSFPLWISGICMFILQCFINFFIPSGSGQALITLPTMLPISDIVGLNRQIAILAYQFGDGITNLFYPTVGCLIGFLEFSKIPFKKWIRYIMPLVGILFMINVILLTLAVAINYGPY
jgi:uncharacterized ion transporter superfamily protein YfcC